MTAISLFVGQDAATLLCDAGWFDEAGRVTGIETKIGVAAPLRLAMATSGHGAALFSRIQPALAAASSQAEALAALPTVMREADADCDHLPAHNNRVVIALWDDQQQRPRGFYMIGANGPAHERPYVLLEGGFCQPAVEDQSLIPSGALTLECARELITEQRRTLHDDGTYRVGGYAALATVTADGISTEIVCHWPEDRVGEKVDPFMPPWKRTLRRFVDA